MITCECVMPQLSTAPTDGPYIPFRTSFFSLRIMTLSTRIVFSSRRCNAPRASHPNGPVFPSQYRMLKGLYDPTRLGRTQSTYTAPT